LVAGLTGLLTAFAGAVPATAAPAFDAKAFPVIDAAPVWPGTSLARRLAWQQQEPQHRRLQQQEPVAPTAADFSALQNLAWSIEYQDITAEIVPSNDTVLLTIRATIRVNPKGQPLSMASFFLTEVKSDTLKVTGASDTPLTNQITWTQSGYNIVEVELAEPVTPGESTEVQLQAVAPLNCQPGSSGLGIKPCALTESVNYLAFTRYYLSSAESQHSVAKTTLHVITPAGDIAAAPGVPTGPDPLPNGKTVWHFEQLEATDNAGFAVAKFKPLVHKGKHIDEVRIFARGSYASNAKTMAILTDDIIGFFGQRFVDFPWKVGLNLIQLDDNFGGGYAPLGAAFMLRSAFGVDPQESVSSIELIAHEIGHQWWGNLVSPLTGADVSLSESLAEYSSCLYSEKVLESRGQILGNTLSYLYSVPPQNDTGVGTSAVTSSPNYFQIVYHKGSMVMDMLRREIGEDKFHEALEKYATDNGRDYARLVDLKVACEAVTGRDLDWFFDQWFLRKGAPRAQVAGRVIREAGKTTVRLRLVQDLAAKYFRFTLPVRIDMVDGSTQDTTLEVIPDSAGTFVGDIVVPAGDPVRIRVDPLRQVLRYFAVGTPGDVNLSGQVDGADLVDQALRSGRGVRVTNGNGQSFFYPDYGFNELSDLNADLRVNDADTDVLLQWTGVEAETF
jgi:hypothetical protein